VPANTRRAWLSDHALHQSPTHLGLRYYETLKLPLVVTDEGRIRVCPPATHDPLMVASPARRHRKSPQGVRSPLDWHALWAAFGLVLVAELGDKTQLATMMLAADHHAALAVFLGAAGALVLVAGASALVGDSLYHLLPPATLHKIAGAAFVVLGVLLFIRR